MPAERRTLLTHRPSPSRGQQDVATASHEHIPMRCPSCGRDEIEADRRYGNKLKGREGMRRVFRSPLYWIGLALLFLPAWVHEPVVTGQVAWRYSLEALGMVLILIPTTDPASCFRSWRCRSDFLKPGTRVAHVDASGPPKSLNRQQHRKLAKPEVPATPEPQEAETGTMRPVARQEVDPSRPTPYTTMLFVLSFVAGIFLSWVVGVVAMVGSSGRWLNSTNGK